MVTIYSAIYSRIHNEVRDDMPDATRRERMQEYRRRCDAWKRKNGLK